MPVLKPVLRSVACCALLTVSVAGTSEACVSKPQPAVVVTLGANGVPEVNRDPIVACEGDEIRWVFQGGPDKLEVIFKSLAESPFDWAHRTGGTVTGTIRAGAAADSGADGFKYDVDVNGRRLDPKIIVEP
jgi:hypothetical protein